MAGVQDAVKVKYGAVAESTLSSNDAGVKAVAEAFGYSTEELTSIPAEAKRRNQRLPVFTKTWRRCSTPTT